MMPLLFSIGPLHVYSLSVFLVLAWCLFSFIFWRGLRDNGIAEDHIFDMTFYSSLIALICARLGYAIENSTLFRDNVLKVVAMWVAPGLSLYSALVAGLLILVYLSRRYKVRVGLTIDAFVFAFLTAYCVGLVGAFLDGTSVGLGTALPWGVRYVGHVGLRHPVHVYEFIFSVFCAFALIGIGKRAKARKWPYGLFALSFFALFTTGEFILEFFKDSHVYLGQLRANQWILIALFAETMGAFYVRGGGREKGRIVWYSFQAKCSKLFAFILKKKKSD